MAPVAGRCRRKENKVGIHDELKDMNSIDEIRTNNLRLLSDEQGGVGRLAHAIGREPSQVSQWLNRSPNHGTGKPRVISTRSCRVVEKELGKPDGWMDRDQVVSNVELSAEVLFKGFSSMSGDAQQRFFQLLGEAYVLRADRST